MDDAIRAVIELMETDSKKIKVRSSYNLGALSFTPKTLYESLLPLFPNFEINYAPDFRQEIAESWPQSIDDSSARNDWGWQPQFDLKLMVEDMCYNLINK